MARSKVCKDPAASVICTWEMTGDKVTDNR